MQSLTEILEIEYLFLATLTYCNNLFFAQFTGNTYFHPLPLGVDVNLGLAVQSSWTCLLKI